MNSFNEKVKEKIKQYSNQEYLDGYIKEEFLTDDGDADIFIYLDSKEELFDSRTRGKQKELNSEIYDFIEDKSSMLDNDTRINFHINGIELTSKEQGIVKHLVKEHYAIELYKSQNEYLKIKNKIFKLIILGLTSFLLYIFFFFATDFDFFIEVFGFIFSFALWEGFDAMIYSLSEIKEEREAITQNLLMDIEFNDINIKD
ncbi:MAG: hypothetical protein IKH54_05490 [Bacilli bacterium]|nr:hypothetical protein [Bacilli bacterium]